MFPAKTRAAAPLCSVGRQTAKITGLGASCADAGVLLPYYFIMIDPRVNLCYFINTAVPGMRVPLIFYFRLFFFPPDKFHGPGGCVLRGACGILIGIKQ